MYFNSHNDLPSKYYALEGAAYRLLGIEPLTDDEVWGIARELEELPHLGNLRASLFFSVLKDKILELGSTLDVEYYIDSLCTDFYVNEDELTDKYDLREVIEAIKRK